MLDSFGFFKLFFHLRSFYLVNKRLRKSNLNEKNGIFVENQKKK